MAGAGRIILDWGTSSFRAYRFDLTGAMIDERKAAAGILTVEQDAFAAVLEHQIGDWLVPGMEVWLSGMITSRNGWIETPYIEAPATLAALSGQTVDREYRDGIRLRFLPGVCVKGAVPDVMRGEEIQVFGSVAAEETATIVLPGTHSKWVRVQDGLLQDFRSFMTGEVYGALKGHTILGRLLPPEAPLNEEAFLAGVRQALAPSSAGLLSDIFTVRSGVLLERFAAEEIADRLSGLVIGHEIRGGMALGWAADRLKVVGDAALVERYLLALSVSGIEAVRGSEQAAVDGFRRLGAVAFSRQS
jgi:2-dehydro-3-deoxygalactonokinase